MDESLFTVSLTTDDWSSEYGCLFVVAANDEAEARKIIEDLARERWTATMVEIDIEHVGTARSGLGPGIISEFTT
jgi:hypothetical protein